MTQQTLGVAMVLGAALIAVWLYCRQAQRTPESMQRVMAHAAGGFAATALVPLLMVGLATNHSPVRAMVALFAFVLPAFTYAFLTWIWLIKLFQRLLQRDF